MVNLGRAAPALPRQGRWRPRMVTVVVGAVLATFAVALAGSSAAAATVDPTAWYVLINRNSGKALDVYNLASNDGARITQWTRNDGAQQQWQFVDSGSGYYRVRSRHSGKVLDVYGWSTADNAAIVQWTDHNSANQQFRLADSPDGYVRLINRNSNKTLDVQGAATSNGANIIQWSDHGGANQQWQLVRVGGGGSGALPSTFRWSSSGILAGPKPDAQHSGALAIKDFSVVRHNNQWLIYATTASPSGWGLVQFAFGDWSQAASAPHTYLDTSPIGPGYRAAPQLFYFAPQNLWYLVYQTGPPTYSTSTNPADPRSWSTPRTFISQEPPIVQQNKGNGGWIDFWVICDASTCYLFFSDDNGHIYRAQTSLTNFPNGFGNTVMIMSDSNPFALFEATNVYKVEGQNQYLLIQEAIGSTGRRYFRSWTSSSLTGSWTPLATTEAEPFAGRANVTFPGGVWTHDISHGDMVRVNNDQTQTISPCRLQYVYQGMDPSAGGDYLRLPWRMGLLTQTNSTC